MDLPNDPAVLLSFVNTRLRNGCPTLAEFCARTDTDQQALQDKLAKIDYYYDPARNQFV